MNKAKCLWYKHLQKTTATSKDFKQVQVSLGLYKDKNGKWRCGGRLSNANIELSAKHPVLLPNDHPFSILVVEECHREVKHNGVRETLCQLRTRYWIIRGRQFVKKVIAKCTTCKRYEGGTYQIPPQPALPDFRVTDDSPLREWELTLRGLSMLNQSSQQKRTYPHLRHIFVYSHVPLHELYIWNLFQTYLPRRLFGAC
jgi:hypothetical protein